MSCDLLHRGAAAAFLDSPEHSDAAVRCRDYDIAAALQLEERGAFVCTLDEASAMQQQRDLWQMAARAATRRAYRRG
jgi:hypothetical protein